MDFDVSTPEFDRSTAAGRRAEIEYLDTLTDEDVASLDLGHRFVNRRPAESAEQREVLLRRLAEAEARYDARSLPQP